jgi:uncharacterized protein (DUF2141 family)
MLLRLRLLVPLLVMSGCAHGVRGVAPSPEVPDQGLVTVTVRVHGVAEPRGTLNVGLYSSEETWLSTDYSHSRNGRVGRVGEVIELVMEDVPAGVYAASLFQDLDDTSSLSRNALGIPTDPWAMSNDAVGSFGPATFESAAVAIVPPKTILDVRLRTGLGILSDVPDLQEVEEEAVSNGDSDGG